MRAVCTTLSVLVVLAMADAAALSSDHLQVTATPSDVMLGVTEELVVDCRALVEGVHLSMIMALFHDDLNGTVTPVAKQITDTTVVIITDNSTSAVGGAKTLDDDNDSFLTVTIKNPGKKAAGYYSCNFEYFNEAFDRNEPFSAGVNVTVSEVFENVTEIFKPENATCCCCEEVKAEIAELRASLWEENRILKEALGQRATAAPASHRAPDTCRGTAFTARFTSQMGGGYGPEFSQDMDLYFDDVIANSNDAFDRSNGKFTARCTGSYLFSLTLRAYQNYNPGEVSGVIKVNGEAMARTFQYYDHDSYNDASASVTVTLVLQQGDDVTTSLETMSQGRLGGAQYSTFTGAFLG